MAKQRYIKTSFWDDPFIQGLSIKDKYFFIYLLTNPLTNLCGIYEITMKRICYDTGLSETDCIQAVDRLSQAGKLAFLDNWMVIFNFIKNQAINPSITAGIIRELNLIPLDIRKKLNLQDEIDSLSQAVDRLYTGRYTLLNLTIPNLTKPNITKPNLSAGKKNDQYGVLSIIPDEWKNIYKIWLDYKKDRKESYKNQDTAMIGYKKLVELSDDNINIAKKIIEQSIAFNYAGFFKLKEGRINNAGNSKFEQTKRAGEEFLASLDRE